MLEKPPTRFAVPGRFDRAWNGLKPFPIGRASHGWAGSLKIWKRSTFNQMPHLPRPRGRARASHALGGLQGSEARFERDQDILGSKAPRLKHSWARTTIVRPRGLLRRRLHMTSAFAPLSLSNPWARRAVPWGQPSAPQQQPVDRNQSEPGRYRSNSRRRTP